MKFVFAFWLLFLVVSISQQSLAQKEIEIGGVKYIQHTVTKSETVFSLCRKYKITQKEILQANPGLTAVLQAGTTIRIPVGKVTEQTAAPVAKKEATTNLPDSEEYYYHKVSKNQTIFTISKQYGITANDLIRNNPELTNGLVVGQILKVPVDITNVASQEANASASQAAIPTSEYTVHPVVSGETLFSLEQRYSVTHDEMLKYNPALQNGLKTGMKLKIPVKATAQAVETAPATQAFTKYRVEKGETLFSLAARFGVEVNELKKANPSLASRSLEAGETILIPQISERKSESPLAQTSSASSVTIDSTPLTACSPLENNVHQKYKVGLLLPFYLSGNDKVNLTSLDKSQVLSKLVLPSPSMISASDTTVVFNGVNIDPKAESFLEFYEGALLAIDSLQRRGMNIELFVFDASNQQMINTLLQMEEFLSLNLIIGPVYPELQGNVASFAAKNRIPMVSPLASNGNLEQNNSWYFKVSPTKEYQTEETASYITDEFSDKNFILLQQSGNSNSTEARLGQLSKEKLDGRLAKSLFHEYNFQTNGVNAIKPLLDESGENIFMIPTDNEAQVSVAVTNLNALAENYNIVLMGTPTLIKLKSIQTENYHKIRLRYLSPFFVDYNKPLVKRFVSQYREIFSAEPSQFSFQGFDVSYYFLSAMLRYGKDFRNCLPDYPMELTQTIFHFRKVAPMGGLMNYGLFVTAYERNFDVLNYGVVGN
jgi:LysM repeat protein/ABC-type branched-subunit amino acid transport system substrate-binding protein